MHNLQHRHAPQPPPYAAATLTTEHHLLVFTALISLNLAVFGALLLVNGTVEVTKSLSLLVFVFVFFKLASVLCLFLLPRGSWILYSREPLAQWPTIA